MSQSSCHIMMTIEPLQDHKYFLKAVLTHEVFKHGLLMSQQVVNNGFPSIDNMGSQAEEIRHWWTAINWIQNTTENTSVTKFLSNRQTY